MYSHFEQSRKFKQKIYNTAKKMFISTAVKRFLSELQTGYYHSKSKDVENSAVILVSSF